MNATNRAIKCEHCEREYTISEYNALEVTGHNITWNFDYRRCVGCGKGTTPMEGQTKKSKL